MRYPVQIEKANTKELQILIEEICSSYVNEAKKFAYVSADNEIKNMLSDKSLEQFLAICRALVSTINNLDLEIVDLIGFDDPIDELSRLMQCWITIGSACETAMQIFLAVYISDFKKSGWKQWQNFNYEEIKSSFFDILDNAVVNGHIERNNARALKDVIKRQLKAKLDIPNLYELKLIDLISFFNKEVGWGQDNTDKLHFIRKNRNCIHSFKEREIGNWEALYDILKFFCSFLIDLKAMIPDVDDYLSYEAEMRAEWEAEMRAEWEAEMRAEWEADMYDC